MVLYGRKKNPKPEHVCNGADEVKMMRKTSLNNRQDGASQKNITAWPCSAFFFRQRSASTMRWVTLSMSSSAGTTNSLSSRCSVAS